MWYRIPNSNVGKAAVMRGPIVYCAEQADNVEGVFHLRLPRTPVFSEIQAFIDNGSVALITLGTKAIYADSDSLYQYQLPKWEETDITLIPYYLWANRGEEEMQVYLNIAE